MKMFLVSEARLLYIIDHDIRTSAVGIFNWFVDRYGMLNVVIRVRDVNYIYQITVESRDELHPGIAQYITKAYEVLGFFEVEDSFKEEEVEQYDDDDYFEVK